jgi:hypothetical protein
MAGRIASAPLVSRRTVAVLSGYRAVPVER